MPARCPHEPEDSQAPLRLGNLELASNLFLAPLAGWTTLAFRKVVRGIGGVGLATTELVVVKPLLSCPRGRRPLPARMNLAGTLPVAGQRGPALLRRFAPNNFGCCRDESLIARSRQTEELLASDEDDRPLAVQIGAGTAEESAEAAQILETRGFAAVDLNLGCPVRKIASKGGGAGLARDRGAAAAVARAAAQAVRIPVTAKMRLGWAPGELTAPDLARALADAGVAAIFVHGRTRAQGFSGEVSRSGIRAVVEAVPGLPVIGNGDVRSAEDARRMIAETGCAGVQIGRAAVVNPWIFVEARSLLETGRRPDPPPLEARLAACERHFRLLLRDLPELVAARRFRKVLRAWGRALGAGERFWADAARVEGLGCVRALLDRVRRGETGPGAGGGGAGAEAVVAVPAGPVDAW